MPLDERVFRFLSDEDFERLTSDEKLAYLSRAVIHLRLCLSPAIAEQEPEGPPSVH